MNNFWELFFAGLLGQWWIALAFFVAGWMISAAIRDLARAYERFHELPIEDARGQISKIINRREEQKE
jgi:hypothetical protein